MAGLFSAVVLTAMQFLKVISINIRANNSWADMDSAQRNKVMGWFDALTHGIEEAVLIKSREETQKGVTAETPRRDTVTKDDLVRILQLRQYPDAQMMCAAAQEPMNRRVLDARKSTDTPTMTGTYCVWRISMRYHFPGVSLAEIVILSVSNMPYLCEPKWCKFVFVPTISHTCDPQNTRKPAKWKPGKKMSVSSQFRVTPP